MPRSKEGKRKEISEQIFGRIVTFAVTFVHCSELLGWAEFEVGKCVESVGLGIVSVRFTLDAVWFLRDC